MSFCFLLGGLKIEAPYDGTLKAYLSAVRYLHIAEGKPDPFQIAMNCLQYTLAGIKRSECEQAGTVRERLPITPSLLRQIKAIWEKSASNQDVVMLWAACCLVFFCFLRSAEMTVPSDAAFDPSIHLCLGDVSVDNPATPTVTQVVIKQSKTDPFRKGINLFLTHSDLGPVAALLNYLVVRGSTPGPYSFSVMAGISHGND